MKEKNCERKINNQAMILAAGVGSRLDPLTSQLPKPLCPILGRPVMEHIILLCKEHGFTNLAANTHVMADKVTDYFKDIENVKLNLVYEKQLTGVAGGVRSCKKFLTDDVILVIMGDALTDVDLTYLYEAHLKGGCPVTVGLKEVEDTSQFGVIVADKNNRIISFQEKPKQDEAKSNLANTGIYFFNRNIIDEIPSFEEMMKFDIATDLFQKIMKKNIPLQAININAYWADIGTLKQYHKSVKDSLEGKVKINISAEKVPFGFKGRNTTIDPTAKLDGIIYLGDNVKIGANVTIKGTVYIENNSVVEGSSYVDNSIIWSDSHIGKDVKVINSIIANHCRVNDGIEMISNSVWAPKTIIESHTKPSVVFS